MQHKMLHILDKIDDLAAVVRGLLGDIEAGLIRDFEKGAEASRDDVRAAINALTREEWDKNKDTIHRLITAAEAGDVAATSRAYIVALLPTTPAEDAPTLITQALDAGVPAEDIAVASGLPIDQVRKHRLDDRAELGEHLAALLDADTAIRIMEAKLDVLRERRSEHAQAAAAEGESWYRIAQVCGRKQSTVERWKQ